MQQLLQLPRYQHIKEQTFFLQLGRQHIFILKLSRRKMVKIANLPDLCEPFTAFYSVLVQLGL